MIALLFSSLTAYRRIAIVEVILMTARVIVYTGKLFAALIDIKLVRRVIVVIGEVALVLGLLLNIDEVGRHTHDLAQLHIHTLQLVLLVLLHLVSASHGQAG